MTAPRTDSKANELVDVRGSAPGWKLQVGNLTTVNQEQEKYPSLGTWFVQLWDGKDVVARVYGDGIDSARSRANRIANALAAVPEVVTTAPSERSRSAEEIVQQTNELARALASADGFGTPDGHRFDQSENPRALHYWNRACIAQRILTATDPIDALQELEE